MKEHIIAATIIALGLMAAGFLLGGRYSVVNGAGEWSDMVVRLDRYTGTLWLCGAMAQPDGSTSFQCGYFAEGAPITGPPVTEKSKPGVTKPESAS